MKTKFSFFSIAILTITLMMFSSCKDEEKDVRDTYVGTYQGTKTYTNNGTNYSYGISAIVTKSETSSDKIILTSNFLKDNQEIIPIILKDAEFSAAFTSEINGVSKTVTITNGKFNGNTISYSFTAPGYVTITVNANKL